MIVTANLSLLRELKLLTKSEIRLTETKIKAEKILTNCCQHKIYYQIKLTNKSGKPCQINHPKI